MNVILIGAGRGERLMPLTRSEPKTYTHVAGKRVLDWTLDAFRQNDLDRFVFIGGYLIDLVKADYPEFQVVENADWANNNILFSLIHARVHMANGFYAAYTDTLFRPNAVTGLKNSAHDITIVIDTLWRRRYRYRSQHPEADGEKVVASGGGVMRISREIPSEQATGEFTGVMRMSAKGAGQFLEFYDHLYARFAHDGKFAGDRPFRMAYLIHQLELMVQDGIAVHCVRVPGDYHEIDTLEDYDLARVDWERFVRE